MRAGLIALCLLLTFAALTTLSTWRDVRAELLELLRESDTENLHQSAIRRVTFERTAHHAQLIVVRTLVYDVLTNDPTAASVELLDKAREMALAVLGDQPNSWQASMFLGAATYLKWSLESDRRLFTSAGDWERPLLKAVKEAEGKPEPRRFLLSAYLETWSALSPEKKAFAQSLLRQAFRDDSWTFRRLIPTWLEVAEDRSKALEAIPDRPGAWQILAQRFAAESDWDSFCMARERQLDALERQLDRSLNEAEQRLQLGDLYNGRTMSLGVIVAAPRNGRFAGHVIRALELYPPGLHGLRSKGILNQWLSWALNLHTVSIDPFPPRILSRLTDAIGELEPPVGALAALISDDLYHTRRYEKLDPGKDTLAWAPFQIAKSNWLVQRDELTEAAEALAQVHRTARSGASYLLAKNSLAQAAGDLVALAGTDRRLAELRTRQWPADDWRWQGDRAKLYLYPEVAATGLLIEVGKLPAGGAVVEVLWDGTSVAHLPLVKSGAFEVTVAVEPRLHLLELRSIAGGEVYPGRVRLVVPGDLSS